VERSDRNHPGTRRQEIVHVLSNIRLTESERHPLGVRKSSFVSHTPDVKELQSDSLDLDTENTPAAKASLTGEEIRERMALIRLQIDERSDEVVAQVNALSDWRSYVRRYPWVSVGAAAVLGYVLVPSRAKPSADGSTRKTEKHPAAFTTDELRSVLIGAARKAATAYASKTLGSVVNSFVAADDQA